MNRSSLIRIYIYEALVLVVTNALIGFSIGVFVGNLLIYLFCINLAFVFDPILPLSELRTVLILSLLFALLSTYGSIK